MIRRPPRSTLFPTRRSSDLVVFRTLLAREPRLPPWRELAYIYRRLEARGEIRGGRFVSRSEEHTSELQSQFHLVCRLLLEKKKKKTPITLMSNTNISVLVLF